MAREKKITIKPVLNQEVKGRSNSPLEELKFPLYLEITYNRKFTKFPFGDNWLPLSMADNLVDNQALNKAIEAVRKIIRYEIERNEDFVITGVANTVKSYLSPFQLTLLMLLIQHLKIELEQVLPVAQFSKWLELSPSEVIEVGLKKFQNGIPDLINDLLSCFQILNLGKYDGSLLEWLVYFSDDQRLAVVNTAFDNLKTAPPPYFEFGGMEVARKKMTDNQIASALVTVGHLVTDNQVTVSARVVQI